MFLLLYIFIVGGKWWERQTVKGKRLYGTLERRILGYAPEDLKEKIKTNPDRSFYSQGHRETVPNRLQGMLAAVGVSSQQATGSYLENSSEEETSKFLVRHK